MAWTHGMLQREKKSSKYLVEEKPEQNRPLSRWKDNIKIGLKEIR
jgi:hypothetical protein